MSDTLATPTIVAAPSAVAGFAAKLRDRTFAVHREAERTGFIADLIRGRATRAAYALYLRNLVPVYDALEGLAAHSAFAPFAEPRLHRAGALRSDLDAIAGPDWATVHPLLPEAAAYVRAVRAAAESAKLVAHGYARYLGDLSGGQILKPVLARTLDLPPSALAFYDFPGLASVEQQKLAMRDALNTLDPDGGDAEAIIEEAIAAFRHNIAVSQAVSQATDAPSTVSSAGG